MRVQVCAMSHSGLKRLQNTDATFVNGVYSQDEQAGPFVRKAGGRRGVYAVFDGIGAGAGKAVSLAAQCLEHRCEGIQQDDTDHMFLAYIRHANGLICDERGSTGPKLGCSLALLRVLDAQADLWNLGDCRVYLQRDDRLLQLSSDHTVAQQKVSMGLITQLNQASPADQNKITQYLGIPEEEMLISPHHAEVELRRGDRFLLCTNGLTKMVSKGQIASAMEENRNPEKTARRLVELANVNGGADNISVVVVWVK